MEQPSSSEKDPRVAIPAVLRDIVGKEKDSDDLNRALRNCARDYRAPVVGAMHVTCADESERECVESFQEKVAQPLLPSLKLSQQSSFRLANLGGRYEWGAVRIAEAHYATVKSQDAFKVMLVKIHSHVSADDTPEGRVFGTMSRYREESQYCGALHALMGGGSQPFLDGLRESFSSEGKDRLKTLLDPEAVDPSFRAFFAALTCARLQARKAILDIQDYQPITPTLYLVVPCATLNRQAADTEILCGVYVADRRGEEPLVEYYGLGDDPSLYRLKDDGWGAIEVGEGEDFEVRAARDHRKLVHREWRSCREREKSSEPQIVEALRNASAETLADPKKSKAVLRTALRLLAQLNPVSASLLLFAEGVADIHHAYSAHRIAKDVAEDTEARGILERLRQDADTMDPDRVRKALQLLVREYGG